MRKLRRRSTLVPALGLLAILALAAGVALAAGGLRATSERDPDIPLFLSRLRIAPRQPGHAARSAPRGPIIGTNDASGWGPAAARTILRGRITWDRVDLNDAYYALAGARKEGFKVLAILNNVELPLSQVNPYQWGAQAVAELKASPGVAIAEAGNETYLKAGVANPAQYGRMYLAAVEDMKAAHLHTTLLFDMIGDIPLGTWADPGSWSEDAKGGGWLRTAVDAVPGLASAIRANGISIHPYGALGENTHDDWGTAAAAAEETVADSVLGSIPPFYVTEIGYSLGRCGGTQDACSQAEQASKLQAAYEVFLADPHIEGIWWYQSHDDSTGEYGFMNNRNGLRPAFRVLSAIGGAVGQ